MADANFVDVQALLSKLTLDEKIELLAGQGSFRMTGLERHGIPALIVSLTGDICEKKAQLTENRLQTVLMEFEVGDRLLAWVTPQLSSVNPLNN